MSAHRFSKFLQGERETIARAVAVVGASQHGRVRGVTGRGAVAREDCGVLFGVQARVAGVKAYNVKASPLRFRFRP
jgi:hypothetical protein